MNLDPAKLPSLNIGIQINGWNTIVPFGMAYFQGHSFRGCNYSLGCGLSSE